MYYKDELGGVISNEFSWKNTCKSRIDMIWYEQNKTVTSYSFGLGESSLDHRRREEFPAISIIYKGK